MKRIYLLLLSALLPAVVQASEADLKIPGEIHEFGVLHWGFFVAFLGILFGLYQFLKVKKLPAHKSMLDVAQVIYKTCSTYLKQQGKFLARLFIFIGIAVAAYFGFLAKGEDGTSFGIGAVLLILAWTVVGMLGSYSVAAYGIRMNTLANSRMAFASLRRNPLNLLNIPLSAGMSIGVVLICVELLLMLVILLLMPAELAGACFIGFAIGESLGASALRIAGGIFTKIADIGSDLMKVVFKIGEDDPRNPGVIADCTGDNAGDSIGPTADGFETYGVTGVALVSFILLAIPDTEIQRQLLVWIFTMRILGIVTSVIAYYINNFVSKLLYGKKDELDFEAPLTNLVWITSILSIIGTYIASYLLIGELHGNTDLWWILATIISCGTFGAAVIPEITKIFTSPKSLHVKEVVKASEQGGASLNILSGFVAGNFSAFWTGLIFVILMFAGYIFSSELEGIGMLYPSIFAFGLIAFGMLGMGPVTIAVDSYGPVTDNAQSVYELSLIEQVENVDAEIEKDFNFKPDWEKSKYYLEANDGAGNTFKATAKPVLIGTAVVGATTMIFSLILMIEKTLGVEPASLLNLLNPYTILGFLLGGAVIYWFTGASTQAVTTGAYRAVEYIKGNINLDINGPKKADEKSSVEVVRICTQYAQKGMFNIFVAIFFFALGIACLSSPSSIGGQEAVSLFVSYLVSIALFGLFQAVFMANAGGSWDNAKKIVEVDLKAKGTPLHDASVVGDTVGDPFKDTSSVALNPIIKFTTLFGLLAMEIAISEAFRDIAPYIGVVFFLVACYFVYRSFYKMRIDK
ncbi:MAG: sodium-translocating pyrophosphatase [Candidatus Onthomorpha sp.]|nr:sodium-translocating pyrophosphatase [Bacteroidales bacterium]MDY5738078.1 sodium-translocating pyrophosphatase [Candidatus Onthomorpha sp.]MCI7563097.1 sodium-translocating pyrophosphatase [Bacteroidales bacterium]MCI7572407.1 sodium-translocating pyrophosphatase [Bacteroidales bacterium]MCI7662534.1 sodium-translocating pyrophosphatase [Bacteroidales bacterium]